MKNRINTEIQFSGLKSGSYTYSYSLNKEFFAAFDNEILSDGDVDFEVKMEKQERLLIFNFTFSGNIKTTCDRCLGELEVPVEGKETLCVKFSDTEESENEDVVVLPESAYKIDLAPWMYEYVVVAKPMQCIHPDDENGDSTCDPEMLKYLQQEEVQEEEEPIVDPRWDKLKEINNNIKN